MPLWCRHHSGYPKGMRARTSALVRHRRQVAEQSGELVHPPGAQGAVDPPEEGLIGEPPGDGAVAEDTDRVVAVVIGRTEGRRQGIR